MYKYSNLSAFLIALNIYGSCANGSDITFPRDETMEFFADSQPKECNSNDLKATKLNAKDCKNYRMKIQKECEGTVIEGMPELLSSDQMSNLMMRFTTCNVSRFLGYEYTNENADEVHKKYKASQTE